MKNVIILFVALISNYAFSQETSEFEIYWGTEIAGSGFSTSNELKIINTSEDSTKRCGITRWSAVHNKNQYNGYGPILTYEFLNYSQSLNSGETINFVITIKRKDGVVMKTFVAWTKA